jgi:hypothetical protein
VPKSSLVHLFFFSYHLKLPLPLGFTYFFYVIYIIFPLPHINIMDDCKQGNMSHICLFNGLFLGEYFLKQCLKSFQKKFQNFIKFSLCCYVKVYVKYFKIYVIFKKIEIYL